jgi:hypothetical protein
MKTFTKQTENTYLENDPVYGNLMLKQEYLDTVYNTIKNNCPVVSPNRKAVDSDYYHTYTAYYHNDEKLFELNEYGNVVRPEENKFIEFDGKMYFQHTKDTDIVVDLPFGKLYFHGYYTILHLTTDECLFLDRLDKPKILTYVSGFEITPYKHTIEEVSAMSKTISRNFIETMFLYRNKEIVVTKETIKENKIVTDKDISIIYLPTLDGATIKIEVPNSGLFIFYINDVRATKKSIMDSKKLVYIGFNLQDKMNNRLEHFRDVLENPMKYKELLNITSPYTDIKTFVNLLYSDKLESWLQVYPNMSAFKDATWEYLVKYYDLFDKNSLVRDLKANFFDTLPKREVVYTLSLRAITGIRLMSLMDSGVGIYNIVKYFSTEQLETLGSLWVDICELECLTITSDEMQFLYKPETERYLDILESVNSVKGFTNLLNITTSYNQIMAELEAAKNILSYSIFGNAELSPLELYEKVKNVSLYHANDTIKMYRVINRKKTLKDFYDVLKTTTIDELHDKYKLVYQAITNAKIEQEYQEVISQLNVQEYDNGTFSITIPKSTQAIIEEGRKLRHCVGIYVDKVVRREDMIFFLRKDREVPYVTIEVKDKKVTQIEGGLDNRYISKDSEEYKAIQEWAKLNKFTVL